MKETFYFSHDYNSRNDPKLQKVKMRLGHEGKSVFWDLIEMLYEQGGYLLISECETYAFELRTSLECINILINDFGLFIKDEVKFWSETVLIRLKKRELYSESRSKAGIASAKAKAERRINSTYVENNSTNVKDDINKNQTSKNTTQPKSTINPEVEQQGLFTEPIEPKRTSTAEINNEKEKNKKKTKEEKITEKHNKFLSHDYFKDDSFVETWENFCDMREGMKSKKGIFTINAQNLMLKELFEFKLHEAIKMLENSIKSSWAGIFPLKDNNSKPQQFKNNAEKSNEALENGGKDFNNEREVEIENEFNDLEFLKEKELPIPKNG